jgi:hypothetical protein
MHALKQRSICAAAALAAVLAGCSMTPTDFDVMKYCSGGADANYVMCEQARKRQGEERERAAQEAAERPKALGAEDRGEDRDLDEDTLGKAHFADYRGKGNVRFYIEELDEYPVRQGSRWISDRVRAVVDDARVDIMRWGMPGRLQGPLDLAPGRHKVEFQGVREMTYDSGYPKPERYKTKVYTVERTFEADSAYVLVAIWPAEGGFRHVFMPLGRIGEVRPLAPGAEPDRKLADLIDATGRDANTICTRGKSGKFECRTLHGSAGR